MEEITSFDLRAVALILRRQNGNVELLAQSFVDAPDVPWRFPGGGIKASETIEEGLLREVKEESGIEALSLVRKLGVQRYYKPYLSRHVERHDYLFEVRSELPESWEHIVVGDGNDAGERFRFQWIAANDIYRIDVELQKFLDPMHTPEFFEQVKFASRESLRSLAF